MTREHSEWDALHVVYNMPFPKTYGFQTSLFVTAKENQIDRQLEEHPNVLPSGQVTHLKLSSQHITYL